MNWKYPGGRFVHTEDMRFFICKSEYRGEWVYTLSDRNELVCSQRGDGALERCKAIAKEREGQ